MGWTSILATLIIACSLMGPQAMAEDAFCGQPHIQAHLERVEQELLGADTSHLTDGQRHARARHVETLRAYREACRFPVNQLAPGFSPVFVDEAGTHCAVAHLMASDGRDAAIAAIAGSRNTATVWDLADEPALQAWLADAGLSLYEAARIEPSYRHCQSYARSCCATAGWTHAFGTISMVHAPTVSVVLEEVVLGTVSTEEVVLGTTFWEAGDEVEVRMEGPELEVGDRVFVEMRGAVTSGRIVERISGGEVVQCIRGSADSLPPVSIDDYVAALSEGDQQACFERLTELHPSLGEALVGDCGPPPGQREEEAMILGGLCMMISLGLGGAVFAVRWNQRRRRLRATLSSGDSPGRAYGSETPLD